MKPDGTNSFSTADEKRVSPEGNHFTEPDVKTGSEVRSVFNRTEPHGRISLCIIAK